MVEFLVKYKFIKTSAVQQGTRRKSTSQHGFLKTRSTLTNLFIFLEEITKWVDDGSPVVVVY